MITGYSRSRTVFAPTRRVGRSARAGMATVAMCAVAQALLVAAFAVGEPVRPAVASDTSGSVRADSAVAGGPGKVHAGSEAAGSGPGSSGAVAEGTARYLLFFPSGETELDLAGREALDLALADHAADRTVTLLARLPEPSAAARAVRLRVGNLRRELNRAGLRVATVLGRPMGPARDSLPPSDAVELLVFPVDAQARQTVATLD